MTSRSDVRNVAIIAHVDHGKTTLVDAMLWQSGAFDAHASIEKTGERVMDSGDLEREKGITILAKNTAITYRGPLAAEYGAPEGIVINVVDTPGHADFGGEVERALSMVDGVVLLVDASEGPLPQTRFVLRKALAAGLPVVLVINKVDRGDARISAVVEETSDLLLNLAADLEGEAATAEDGATPIDVDALLDVPTVYASAKAGRADTVQPADGSLPANPDLQPLFAAILEHIPAPTYDADAPLAAQVTNLDASPFLGRLALLRVHSGEIRKGQTVGWARHDGSLTNVRISELLRTVGLERTPAESASAGDIVAVAGIPEITIGDSLVDPADPRPLPLIHVDDPAISLTIGINTSPLAGKVRGHKLTARQIKDRLDRELVGNVSLKVLPTDRPDAWEVQGRGELALAILVEQMRREGFELTVGKPQVVTKRGEKGELLEPMEHLTIDVPDEHLGVVTQLMAARKGRMTTMANHGTGWVRLEYLVPVRGLIGFRTTFLTETRGTGIASSIAAGYEKWAGEIVSRTTGSLVSDRSGAVTPYALLRLEDRGTFFVEPTAEVYEGQVVGENPRNEDMDVNVVRTKELTNMRSATADVFESLVPPRKLSLEESLEFAADDECVEVTPEIIRIRKVVLVGHERYRIASRKKKANAS